jgi:hypothetical protein
MTKDKTGETRAERKVRRIIEHNDKTLTQYYHFDFEKVSKERKAKELDEEVKRIMVTYSDNYSHTT